jgi:hypothetical protein
MSTTAVDISALAAYAGTYQQALFSILYDSFDAIDDCTLWPGIKNTEKLTKLTINGGAKPFTGTFAPKTGDLQYTGQDLVVSPWQRDMQLRPSDYRNSFMGQARGPGENPNNKNIPFAQYVWSTFLKSLAAGINDQSIYFGLGAAAFPAYNAGTIYHLGDKIAYVWTDGSTNYYTATGTTVAGNSPLTNPLLWSDSNLLAIFPGFGANIAALVTAGSLVPVVTGAIIAATDAYHMFKLLWRSQTIAVRKYGAIIYCSYTDYDFLTDSYETQVTKFTETDILTGITYLATTERKCMIKPVTWMTGSRRLICTPRENMIIATDEVSDLNVIATEEHVYTLDVALSGVLGVAVRDPWMMRVSDQV